MGKCLVTTLDPVVTNDSMPFYGELILSSVYTNGNRIEIEVFGQNNTPITKRIIGSNAQFLDDSGNQIGQTSTADKVFLPADTPIGTRVGISSKYAVRLFSCNYMSVNLSDAYFSEGLTLLSVAYEDDYDLINSKLIGSTKDLKKYENLSIIDITCGYQLDVNVEDLGSLTKLNYARILLNNKISGDLVNLVKLQVASGRTSGDIDMGLYNHGWAEAQSLMFDGVNLAGDYLGTHLVWNTSDGITTVSFTSTNKETLTTTFS